MLSNLKELLGTEQKWITDINMVPGGGFCVIHFSRVAAMAAAVKAVTAAGTYKVFQPHQIAQWFETTGEVAEDIKGPFELAKATLQVPKSG